MARPRVYLSILVIALIVFDVSWYYVRFVAANATITHVGIDSASFIIPAKTRAAAWRNGHWDIDPTSASRPLYEDFEVERKTHPVALITLEPEGSFGKAISLIRFLKSRGICNVLIRESGRFGDEIVDFPDGPDRALDLPALVLCGTQLGDAGFSGTLAPDGPIHIE